MDDSYLIIIVYSLIFIIPSVIDWTMELFSNSKKYIELKPKLDNLENLIKQHNEDFKKEREAIDCIIRQKSMGFPWLAEAFADYYSLIDHQREKYLIQKSHPAMSASEVVREIKNEKRDLVKTNKIISYKINYYEKLFPWLQELIAENEEEEIPVRMFNNDTEDNKEDKVKDFLTPEEYSRLPSIERNQRALDRYLRNRNKSKWAIGRDYEMYVGYLYEQRGYNVEYKGILDGFEDLGRDIIAQKDDEVCIIQCKNWAQYKEIHEKHVFQLFGTTMEYWIKHFNTGKKPKTFAEFAKFLNEEKLRPIFFTSTTMSSKAKEMAEALNIEIIENTPMNEFPRVKCNISSKDNEKIYHLPFDQQYDRTVIEKKKGEFYAFSVAEAENAGFRRAFKHRY